MPQLEESYVMKEGRIKFVTPSPNITHPDSPSLNVDLCISMPEGHPDRPAIEAIIERIVASEPRTSDIRFRRVPWASPIRAARQESERYIAERKPDMTDYLKTRLSRTNCPMDVRGDMTDIRPAGTDNLWPGTRVKLSLNFVGHWVQVPREKSETFIVGAYVLGVRSFGDVPPRLKDLM